MSQSTSRTSLAELVAAGRKAVGMSLVQLAETTGIPKSNLFKIERGVVAKVQPNFLSALSNTLDIPLADLYEAAGYESPQVLPSFTPYLRSKYPSLPAEAQAELEQSFRAVAERYGYDADGPAPGQDEQ